MISIGFRDIKIIHILLVLLIGAILILLTFIFLNIATNSSTDVDSELPSSYPTKDEQIVSYGVVVPNCSETKYSNTNYPKFSFSYDGCYWELTAEKRVVHGSDQYYIELTNTQDNKFKLMFILYPWYPDGGFSFLQGKDDYVVLPNTNLLRTLKMIDWGKIGSDFDYEYNLLTHEGSKDFASKCFEGDRYCGIDPAWNFKTEYIDLDISSVGFFHIVVNSNNNFSLLNKADEIVDTLTF